MSFIDNDTINPVLNGIEFESQYIPKELNSIMGITAHKIAGMMQFMVVALNCDVYFQLPLKKDGDNDEG